jgi:endonuclease YncB( thermonuclease family)
MRSRWLLSSATITLLIGAAGFIWGPAPSPSAPTRWAQPRTTFICTVASITDGDTFRCTELEANGKQIRVRLSGVAAREKDGTCTAGHPCPNAPPEAATAAIRALAEGRRLQCRQVGSTYGRRAAFCSLASGRDLSCAMVASGTVARWDRHWGSHRC